MSFITSIHGPEVQTLTFTNCLRGLLDGQGTLRWHLARATADKDSNAINSWRRVAAPLVPGAERTTQVFSRHVGKTKGNLLHGA